MFRIVMQASLPGYANFEGRIDKIIPMDHTIMVPCQLFALKELRSTYVELSDKVPMQIL